MKTVGEFNQQGSRITGTFLTNSGDYRYLQGVADDTLKLSAFDGSNVFLFVPTARNNDTLSKDIFYAGFDGKRIWSAFRDSGGHLADAFSLPAHHAGTPTLDFTFPNIKGKPAFIHDDRYKIKVVIVQIMGSWCPKCMDETVIRELYIGFFLILSANLTIENFSL
jgi:hypothetical protein